MQIADRYEIIDKIGAGGMGVVYKATDAQTGDTVAVKQLKASAIQHSRSLITRFQREGEALRDLNHPNIVKMLDMITDKDGDDYLVVEYMAGGDLQEVMQAQRLSVRRSLQIALELADALTRAHHLGIIHRDLKPANVLLADDGTPRLTDFGVALISKEERVTETNAIVGTFDYLPPEAMSGQEVDNRADIWSFGVLLYEMIGGQRPFNGETIGEVVSKILTADPPNLEVLQPDAPIALVDLIGRMLQKDPAQRLSSVRLVGAELEAILLGTPLDTDTSLPRPEVQAGRFDQTTPVSTEPRHNLPVETTPFIGRAGELAEVERLVDNPSHRLVTILAGGGMGKTRLAIKSAETQVNKLADGVAFVELAPIVSVNDVPTAIADATGYQFQAMQLSPIDQLVAHLRDKEILLVLDNFEHVVDAANMVMALLQGVPKLQVLVTSRVKLGLSGETVFHLGGMDFPEWETPEDALQYSAVKLFMQSARRVVPDYELTQDDLDAVARICRLVQGMPLGILLAAAWLDTLSAIEIAEEIEESLDFLETDMRDLPERQQSIRAVFEYSWNLLSEKERLIFAKMSLFRGGFDRKAVQKITGASLRNLTSLVNKSLINRDADSGRYQVHELVRQFAEEQLKDMGELEATRDAHARYYADWMIELGGNDIPRDSRGLKSLQTDFENIKQAWYCILDNADFDTAFTLGRQLYYLMRVLLREADGIALFQHARKLYDVPIEEATHPFQRLIYTHFVDHEPDVLERLQRALPVMEARGDIDEIAFVKFSLGVVHLFLKKPQQARKYLQDAFETYPPDSQLTFHMPTIWYLTHAHQYLGDYDGALEWVEKLKALSMQVYKPYLTVVYLEKLSFGILDGDLTGDYAPAKEIMQNLLTETGNMLDRVRGIEAITYQGYIALREGNPDDAQEFAEQALSRCHDGNMLSVKAKALALLAQVEILRGNLDRARRHIQQSEETPRNFAAFREVDYGWTLLHLIDGDYANAGQRYVRYLNTNRTNPSRYTDKFGERVYYAHAMLPILSAIEHGLGNISRAKMLYYRYQQDCFDHRAWAESLPVLQALEDTLATDDPNLIADAETLDLLQVVPEILARYQSSSG